MRDAVGVVPSRPLTEFQRHQQATLAGRRVWAVRLLLLYTLLFIFEGALRKWAFPAQQEFLYFIRVPVVIAMAGNALRGRRGQIPAAAVGVALLVAMLAAFTTFHLLTGQTATSALLGVRLLLEPIIVPLAVAQDARRPEALRVLRLVAALSWPTAILTVVQSRSGRTAFVNKIFLDKGQDNFGLAAGTLRPSGTFSASAGHALFVLLCVAASVVLALEPTLLDRILGRTSGVASALLVATAGSRTALLGSLIGVAVVLIVQIYRHPQRTVQIVLAALVLLGAGLYLGPRVVPKQVAGLTERLNYAGASNEIQGRSLGAFTDWTDGVDKAPTLGFGLGTQSAGFAGNIQAGAVTVEGELISLIYEVGPPLFIVLLAARALVVVALARLALAAVRGRSDVLPLVVAALSINIWAVGPVSGQGSTCGFAAVTAALVLAGAQAPRTLPSRER